MTEFGSNPGDKDVTLRMKKSASSPVLSVRSIDSAGSSRNVTPKFLSEPPPYTSLSPPLVPSLHITEVSLPVQQSSLRSSVYPRNDEEVGEREDSVEDMIYASRSAQGQNGLIAPEHKDGPDLLAAPFSHSSSASVRQNLRGSHTRGRPHPHPHVPSPSAMKSSDRMSLRHRVFAAISSRQIEGAEGDSESDWEANGKSVSTTLGVMCAGETETETDEPSRHLPTARVSRSSGLSNSFSASRSTSFAALPWQTLLFEFSRLLAIVPASLGFIWCIWHMYAYVPCSMPCTARSVPDRIDYFVASLWALLTAHQCLSLTTGLLTRWRHYYPPLSTLVRLLALQGICWPATQLTVNIFEVSKRPAVVWAVIGTTTCTSRSIQMWVVSNLPTKSASSQGLSTDAREREKRRGVEAETNRSKTLRVGNTYWKKWNRWRRKRRWDWREVSIRCVLPAGVLYFIMAWASELRRELGGC
ncbi:hypothetical protein AGABI1DRAFT_130671 [Agaricus bisporus var. burnettii JB137-S8]|uniref:N-glycosylation protein EOS1 n=1 Tax=Agaricus bisporus var. burnettii (strain JB137-S8 / ATCC MYA-4627 / FGSC 10392) TaxID=597362 RepID=K5XQZ3_AGABU|nr:uncharacterized protein AGABI1DRAFT_130671 [Agaricus bisporus var. burnettii JB137-S8]EKM77255.1 hypothetical protein AGABI1DRAFT_130671 [Agaricus bisporus var. burnettii JB137-S8]